jgi:uridine phosphorylase
VLGDLKKEEWLSVLGLSESRVPRALLLRGTRNLRAQYELHRRYFSNVAEVCSPDGLLEDVLIGEVGGMVVAYASVYGASMASEVVHLFGVLGTSLVVQTGACRGLAADAAPGDLFLATEAKCGDGVSRHYGAAEVVKASVEPSPAALGVVGGWPIHSGRVFTTSARMAATTAAADRWHEEGIAAVDQETSATFAVAEHFGMDRAAILVVNSNPRRREQRLMEAPEKDERITLANWLMIDLAFAMMKDAAHP